MKPVIVTKELISEGMSVMRGRDWVYSDQEGKPGSKGIVKTVSPPGLENWCTVEWENGARFVYRVGVDNKYDLYVYAPGYYDPNPQGKERLTRSNVKTGLQVELRSDASDFARGNLGLDKKPLEIRGWSSTGVQFQSYSQTYKFENFDICTEQTVKESVAKVALDDGEKIQLKDPSSFKWGFETPRETIKEAPVYKFRKGDIVYLNPNKEDSWIFYTGIRKDLFYSVEEIKDKTFKLYGVAHWQVQDNFISRADWENAKIWTQTRLTTTPMLDLRELQGGTVAIAENSKTNTNSQNGNNTDYSGTRLNLPAKNLTLKRGERPEGFRLRS